jgi:hypothetical protein
MAKFVNTDLRNYPNGEWRAELLVRKSAGVTGTETFPQLERIVPGETVYLLDNGGDVAAGGIATDQRESGAFDDVPALFLKLDPDSYREYSPPLHYDGHMNPWTVWTTDWEP